MFKSAWKSVVLMLVAILVTALMGGGCYCFVPVQENEVGLQMNDGVAITKVVGPGRTGAVMTYYAAFKTIDCQAKIIQWNDSSVVTQDKQPIGFDVAITVRRDCSDDGIRNMWRLYNDAARHDEALALLVKSRAPDAAKAVTTRFTLDEMLGIAEDKEDGATPQGDDFGRVALVSVFKESLKVGLDGTGVLIEAININDIAPSQAYLDGLEDKANAQVQAEVSKAMKLQLDEQLVQEQSQTAVDVEIAKRQNQVNEELSRVYDNSPQYYELEKLRLLKDVIGASDKLYFVPQGTDLTLILSGESNNVVPVQ